MDSLWLAAVFAVFIWWFSTGLVLLLDNLPRTTFAWSRLLSTALAVGALWALARTSHTDSVAAAYCAFTSALLVWGWHELAFLTGWITGPRTTPIGPEVRGWPRLRAAVAAILWHELAIAAVGIFILWLTWGTPNPVGAWTYGVLWLLRISAKLNLFLGVRNLSEEFLPPQLVYLASFFRRRSMNWLWPWSVGLGALGVWQLLAAAAAPGLAPGMAVGLTLVAVLLALAVIEHLLLVLPLQASALWGWAMPRHGIDGEAAGGAPGEAPSTSVVSSRAPPRAGGRAATGSGPSQGPRRTACATSAALAIPTTSPAGTPADNPLAHAR
jgi:putative photosynthetic complex assembly protein 2